MITLCARVCTPSSLTGNPRRQHFRSPHHATARGRSGSIPCCSWILYFATGHTRTCILKRMLRSEASLNMWVYLLSYRNIPQLLPSIYSGWCHFFFVGWSGCLWFMLWTFNRRHERNASWKKQDDARSSLGSRQWNIHEPKKSCVSGWMVLLMLANGRSLGCDLGLRKDTGLLPPIATHENVPINPLA